MGIRYGSGTSHCQSHANWDSGLPPGYTKSLERRVRQLENFIKMSTADSPIPRNQFDVILERIQQESEGSQDLDRYISPLVMTTEETSPGTYSSRYNETLSPSPSNSARSLSDEYFDEPRGLLSVNENSVISHVRVTSGIHFVMECEKIDREVWY